MISKTYIHFYNLYSSVPFKYNKSKRKPWRHLFFAHKKRVDFVPTPLLLAKN